MPVLPHAYPFRLVEPHGGGTPGRRPVLLPSLGAAMPRQAELGSAAEYPLSLAVEAMAQAVLAAPPAELQSQGSRSGSAHLAGIEEARLLAAIEPGDRLEAHAEVAGRFGPAAKLRCRLVRNGEPVAEAILLLTLGG